MTNSDCALFGSAESRDGDLRWERVPVLLGMDGTDTRLLEDQSVRRSKPDVSKCMLFKSHAI